MGKVNNADKSNKEKFVKLIEKKINEQISAIKGLINSLGLQISTKL